MRPHPIVIALGVCGGLVHAAAAGCSSKPASDARAQPQEAAAAVERGAVLSERAAADRASAK